MKTLREIIIDWGTETNYVNLNTDDSKAVLSAFIQTLSDTGFESVDLRVNHATSNEYRKHAVTARDWCKQHFGTMDNCAIVGGFMFFANASDAVTFKLAYNAQDVVTE